MNPLHVTVRGLVRTHRFFLFGDLLLDIAENLLSKPVISGTGLVDPGQDVLSFNFVSRLDQPTRRFGQSKKKGEL